MSRRAVITGIGVVAPTGIGTDAHWDSIRKGQSALGPITGFDVSSYPVRVAGQVATFDAEAFIDRRLIVQTDRWTHMALAASQMALEDAGLDPATREPYSMGVITASSSGGNEFGQKEIQNLWGQGPRFVGAYQSIAWFYAATTGQLCIKHGMKGHSSVLCAEGAGGLEALNQARRAIGRGLDHVVSGGTEAPLSPYALTCQTRQGSLSSSDDPALAYLPFDARAGGYVPGEGGAVLVVEELGVARERGVPQLYAEIAGYAATNDAHHESRTEPTGRYYARALRLALDRAGVTPDEVDVVFADGAGTPDGDRAEASALREVFGGRRVPVTVPKTMVGRMYAGGASLDVATAALAMRDRVLPPTVNVGTLAPGCDLELVTETTPAEIRTALVGARGTGGFNAAMVLRSPATIDR